MSFESSAQEFPTCRRARGEPASQPVNEGMRKPFFGHAALDLGNMVGQLHRQFVDTMNELIGVHAQFFGLSAPVANLDVSETVFTAEFHGKLDTLDVDPGVGEDTGQIVQGRQTNPAAGADEQGVVLRMSVRAHDQPVEGN